MIWDAKYINFIFYRPPPPTILFFNALPPWGYLFFNPTKAAPLPYDNFLPLPCAGLSCTAAAYVYKTVKNWKALIMLMEDNNWSMSSECISVKIDHYMLQYGSYICHNRRQTQLRQSHTYPLWKALSNQAWHHNDRLRYGYSQVIICMFCPRNAHCSYWTIIMAYHQPVLDRVDSWRHLVAIKDCATWWLSFWYQMT